MQEYYKSIENYYDSDAGDFDKRYWNNQVLQELRQAFREKVYRFEFDTILEVGYGTGLDMAHFAMTFPESQVFGVDISGEMQEITSGRFTSIGLTNARAEQGSVEDIESRFPGIRYDLIYVFFGALNTVEDLEKAAGILRNLLNPNGVMVLSFVNKWYLAGMFIESLKGRFRAAFARLRKVWGGYSPTIFLPSRCYSPRQVYRAFRGMKPVHRHGFSIIHPAWYYHGLNRMPLRLRHFLWKFDLLLNKSFLWRFGEYSLYVFKATEDIT